MKKFALKLHLIGIFLFSAVLFSQAQQANNWYFGSAGCFANTGMRIDFTSGSAVVSTGSPMLTEEGSSSISDASGIPLFYTDGTDAWNAATNVKFSTFALGGNTSSSQSAIILPHPVTPTTKWFIFTVDVNGNNGAHYVTIQKVGAVFSVIEAAPVAMVGAGIIGEGLCIVGSTKAASAYWVIMRDRAATGQIRAFEVTAAGAVSTGAAAVTSTLSGAGFTQATYDQYIGIIKSNTCQNKLAFTYYNNDVDISDFDPSTGKLIAGGAKKVSNSIGHSYGLEFSPNDKYLYVTALDEGKVYQYNIAAPALTLIGNVSGAGSEAGQLQIAPDSNIYMARMNGTCPATSWLATIGSPNTAAPVFTANALLLTGVSNGAGNVGGSFRGLPTFTKSLIAQSLTAQPGNGGYCTNTNIPLTYNFGGFVTATSWTITPGAAGVDWTYVVGTSTSAAPTVKFLTPNTYTVTAHVTDNCSNNYSFPMTITITLPKVPAGLISCGNGTLTLTASGAIPADYPNYVWYDAAAGGNILGVGSPVTINDGDFSHAPTSVWVEVAGSVTTTSSGSAQNIGPASGSLSWGGRGAGNYSTTFTVFASDLTLTSFVVTPQGATGTFDVEIKNGSGTVVYLKNYTAGAVASPYTVAINTDLPPGTYTITLKNSGSIVWGGGSWAGAINAQISLPTSGGAGTYGIANMIYNYQNFSTTTTCTNRVKVDRKCLTVLPGNGTYCTNSNIALSYTFEGTAILTAWTITPGVLGTDWAYVVGTSASVAPTIKFLTTGTYTVNVAVTDVSTIVYNQPETFTIIAGSAAPSASVSCTSPVITFTANGSVPADYPNYTYYDAAVGGNVLGVGNPVSVDFGGNTATAPTSFWVEVSSAASITSSGANKTIGIASGGLGWAASPSNFGPAPFTVIAGELTLKSFEVKGWAATGNFDVTIKNSSAVTVFKQTYNMPTASVPFVVNINTTFPAGSYTISLGNTSIQWWGSTWNTLTNPGEITLPTFFAAGEYPLANFIYDFKSFSVTPSCPTRVLITNTCSLPITLLSFTGSGFGGKNFLSWSTAVEINNAYFEVQKSTDGTNFETIGKVDGNGTTNTIHNYSFTDNNVTGGITYYRLVQHDYNNQISYSNVISIKANGGVEVTVAPNPSHDAFTVALNSTEGADLTLLDVLGRVVATTRIAQGSNTITIGADLQSGTYILQVKTANDVVVEKLIKE